MEGVPRLPMINFDLKLSTKHVEFSSAIKNFISENYLEDAEKFNRECLEIEKLREQATSVSLDFIGCSSLKKYFCQIEFLLNRFLIKDGGDAFNISFSWEDSMVRREVTHNDIRYEQACILFNVGSLHSKLGSMENRLSPEGMKVSCTHFQCAAWAYQHLADKFEGYSSADFNKDLLASHSTVMLAQAQECILEKSMTDNRKSSITAKVSAQIVDYYKHAIKHLDAFVNSTSINNKQTKEWKKRMLLKLSFYDCITYYYAGLQAEEASQWGQRLAYLKVSTDKLQELMKNNKLEDQAVDESLKFMVDVIGGKYNIAKKDNDFIYHDKVPDEENLLEIKGASLVKGIPLNVDDPGISGADIFMKLVPFKVHQISSMYSEEKAKILRKIGQEVEEKDEEMKNFLNVLQLTTSDSISPPAFTIPESLLEKCASLSVRPDAIKDLSNAMMALSSRSTDVEGDLNATIKIVDGVEQGIQDILDKHGIKLDGLNECNVIRDECSKLNDVLKGASQSNEELHKLMQFHISNLKLLCGSVEELMQIAASHQYKPSDADTEVMNEMKRLLSKTDEMLNQRKCLLQQLRKQLQKDDITQKLVMTSASTEDNQTVEIFEKNLSKHNQQLSIIQQNLQAQSNIMHTLTEVNATYAPIRKKIAEANKKQNEFVSGSIKSFDVYEDLLMKTKKGVEFYNKIGTNVGDLLKKAQNLAESYQSKENKIKEKLKKSSKPTEISSPQPMAKVKLPPRKDLNFDVNDEDDDILSGDITNLSLDNMMLPQPQTGSLKLKDFLPFMKPSTFGVTSTSANSAPKLPPTTLAMHSSNALSKPIPTSFQALPQAPSTVTSSFDLTGDALKSFPPLSTSGNDLSQQVLKSSVSSQLPSYLQNYQQFMQAQVPNNSHTSMPQSSGYIGSLLKSNQFDQQPQPSQMLNTNLQVLQPQNPPIQQPSFQLQNSQQVHQPSSSQQSYQPTFHHPTHQPFLPPSSQFAVQQPPQQVLFPQQQPDVSQPYVRQQQSYSLPSSHVSSPIHRLQNNSSPLTNNLNNVQFNSAFNMQPQLSLQAQQPNLQPSYLKQQQPYFQQQPTLPQQTNLSQPNMQQQSTMLPQQPNLQQQSTMLPQQPNLQQQSYMQQQPYMPQQSHSQQPNTPQQSNVQQQLQPNVQQFNVPLQQISLQQPIPSQQLKPHLQQLPNSSQMQQIYLKQQTNVQPQLNLPLQSQHLQQPLEPIVQPQHQKLQPQQPYLQLQQPNLQLQHTQQPNLQQPQQPNLQQPSFQQQQPNLPQQPNLQQQPNQPNLQQTNFQQQSQHLNLQQPQQPNLQQPQSNLQQSILPHQQQLNLQQQQQQQPFFQQLNLQHQQQQSSLQHQPNSQQQSYVQQQQQQPNSQQLSSNSQQITSQQPYLQQQLNAQKLNSQQIIVGQQRFGLPQLQQPTFPQSFQTPQQSSFIRSSLLDTTPPQMDAVNLQPFYSPAVSNKGVVATVQLQQQSQQQQQTGDAFLSQHQLQSSIKLQQQQPLQSQQQPMHLQQPLPQQTLPPQHIPTEGYPQSTATTTTMHQHQDDKRNIQQHTNQHNRKSSSTNLDEILSTDLNMNNVSNQQQPLQPKIMTPEDIKRQQNEEERKNLKLNTKDPFSNQEALNKLSSHAEKLMKHVDALCKVTLNKHTLLDKEWKELSDEQEKSTKHLSMAVARCYPLKNKHPDMMPFDSTRIKLLGSADDYINASLIKSMSAGCPDIIASQSPFPVTFADFWQMLYDYNVEIVVMLCNENETVGKNNIYWPVDKSLPLNIGSFNLALHSIQIKSSWTERIIYLTHNKQTHLSRLIMHLQYNQWPPGAEPTNVDGLLEFMSQVHCLYLQQRNIMKPIVVHCSNGSGRTGTFTVIYTGVEEVNRGHGVIDVCDVIKQMRLQRKYFVQYDRQLKFCYQVILAHCFSVLKKYGVLSATPIAEKVHGFHENKYSLPKKLSLFDDPLQQLRKDAASKDLVDANEEKVPQQRSQIPLKDNQQRSSTQAVVRPDNEDEQQNLARPPLEKPIVEKDISSRNMSSITDIQNPDLFTLDCTTNSKRKITKANFHNQSGSMINRLLLPSTNAPDVDPLDSLDPLWSLKK